jgi:hypothetical protein
MTLNWPEPRPAGQYDGSSMHACQHDEYRSSTKKLWGCGMGSRVKRHVPWGQDNSGTGMEVSAWVGLS